ncbi:MAG: reverse transcriptase domain-containing protein [Kofleriaceae bacterium]
MTGLLAARLADPAAYLPSIERVAAALAPARPAEAAALRREPMAVARRLVAAVAAGWRPAPAARRTIVVDKPRTVVELEPLDRIVHGVVGAALTDVLEPQLPDGLYSYRRGRNAAGAARAVHAAAVAHRAARPDPTTRGLWVIRFDVADYGDSVPIDDDAPLWPMLASALAGEPAPVAALVRTLLSCGAEGEFARRGLPVGSPVANPMNNLYLVGLDRQLAATAEVAVRYGDDVTAVFTTAAAAADALAEAEAELARLGLALRASKLQRLYWTGSGRRPTVAGWSPARHVPVCGLEVAFVGGDRVKTSRRRALLAALRQRLRATARLLPPGPPATRAEGLCQAARALLAVDSPLVLPTVPPLLDATSCRTQLAEMDRAIAVEIAGLAAGVPGPRALRVVSWRSLHAAGLPSLTAQRNR